MSTPFVYEIAALHAAVQQMKPGDPKGIYAIPFYLVIGEPGAGRSTALRAMNLTWPTGDGTVRTGLPQQYCTYWMAQEAVFIEPQAHCVGPRRDGPALGMLCSELLAARPREALDGVMLVLSVTEFVDLDDEGIDKYAKTMRTYLTEIGGILNADVPVYIVVTRYDQLWGFADVFQWNKDRGREDPWGFVMPPDVATADAKDKMDEEIAGLGARFESFCLSKLSSEDPPDQRARAYQHLVEARLLLAKLRTILHVIGAANAYERAPWIRSLTIGSATPGIGDKLRAGVVRFYSMGYAPPAFTPPARPGGLPMHQYMQVVVIPDKDLVPTRVRWRDDKLLVISFIAGCVLLLATLVVVVIVSTRDRRPSQLDAPAPRALPAALA
jgi:type VI protein secretion system component VasK